MIKVLPYISVDDLPTSHGLVLDGEFLIHVENVKAVGELEPFEDGESHGVCFYFSKEHKHPDLIIPTSGQDETNELIKGLEKADRKNKMKVVKLNFNKEEDHEV